MSIRWRRIVDEVLRFLAVGGVATIVAVVLFNFLLHGFQRGSDAWLSGRPLTAYIVANTVGMVISYRGLRRWAFRHREPVHADGGRSMYVVINVVTMTLPIACLWFSRNVLGLDDPVSDNIAANVIGLVLGVSARFFLFRHLVFSRPLYRQTPLASATYLDEDGDEVTEEPTARSMTDPPRPTDP